VGIVSEPRATVVLLEHDAVLNVQRVRAWHRLRVRIRSSRLDRQLASGASPESSLDLSLHAAHLCLPAQRLRLARSLGRVLEACDRRGGRTKAPLCRSAIAGSRTELAAVIERLVGADPVGVEGIARLRSLLAQGESPLYGGSDADRLRGALADVLSGFDSLA
jgi:hypothetical protein